MTKFVVLTIFLLSAASFARECKVADVQKSFEIYTQESLDSFCKNHGGAVKSISATGAGGISNSYPKTALGNFVIKCVNGDLRVGTVFLDAATCLGKGNMTEDTSLIYSK
jgi:putative hemolysin